MDTFHPKTFHRVYAPLMSDRCVLLLHVLLPSHDQAVHRVPIFSPLSLEQKHLVSNALVETHFRPGLYICEEVSGSR